ncbi:flavin reductase [Rhodococcus sp. HM1]|uniref:flavin reductase n=1 Tax=Rhodococcus sp. HM1 TaxID=2937759 RepID=UPI00200A9AA1|nr:flavin reductase [Rhodococcus sp. HM1]MCK8674946.1 flavin reductase [Rhodococcus sp. HM1]
MFDADGFREVLGNHPTGVSLVTGLSEDGTPLGMIVGTFNSVSLDPPLVSFMPMKTSHTWSKMRSAERFCINILAADQQDRCGKFMRTPAEERFADWPWSPSPLGLPILDGGVAWIECSLDQEIEAGDHWIVLGRVESLEVARCAPPLLYFQGGYGRFAPKSLVSLPDHDLRFGVRDAELARPVLERLATALDAECSTVITIGDAAMAVVGSATGPGVANTRRLGLRMPLVPPVGDVFAAFNDPAFAEAWIDRRTDRSEGAARGLRARLDMVRQQGWSASLTTGNYSDLALHQAFRNFTTGNYTPAEERRILSAVAESTEYYSPEPINPRTIYTVGSVVVPVYHEDGSLRSALRVGQIDRSLTGSELLTLADELEDAAREIESIQRADDNVTFPLRAGLAAR